MPGINLTRDEAAIRSTLVKTHSYQIDLDLTTSTETFIAKTCVKFSGLKPGISRVGDQELSLTRKAHDSGTECCPNSFVGSVRY